MMNFMLKGNLNQAEITFEGIKYLKITAFTWIPIVISTCIGSSMRESENVKTPLYISIFATLVNTFFNWVFIYGNLGAPRLEIVGAGIATLISQFASNILCLIYAFKCSEYFKFSKNDLAFNKTVFIQTIKLGVPLSLQFSLIAISCMALQRVVNAYGAIAVAAFTATSRIEQIIHQPYQTLSAALSTFCGQNYGAKKNDRVINGYKKTVLMMLIFTVVMVPLIQIFAEQISAIFVDEIEVIKMSAKAMRITSYFYVFLGMIYVVRGILNGLGDAFFALFNGIVEVIGRFTVPFILTAIPLFGLWGIWWSVGIVWFISGFTAWLRYLYKKNQLIN